MGEKGSRPIEGGFAVEGVFAASQVCERVLDQDLVEGVPLTISWDWRVREFEDDEPLAFEVRLVLELEPHKERPERIKVDMVGRFRCVGPRLDESLSVQTFVMGSGPAMLVPYIRERVTNLTSFGGLGGINLPALNVLSFMEEMEYEDTTGAQQIRDRQATTEKEIQEPEG